MDAETYLRQRLAQARADAVADVPIAGAEDLVVRYQAIGRDELAELRDLPAGDANISILIRSCQALLIRGDDGRLASIDQDSNGAHLDDDGQLAGSHLTYSSQRTWELLDVADAREAVRLLHPREGAIDIEATTVLRLSGYQEADNGPEARSRATRS